MPFKMFSGAIENHNNSKKYGFISDILAQYLQPEKVILRKTGTDDNSVSNCKKLAKKSADQAQNIPPELAQIIDRWPGLPEHIRAAVMALIQSCKPQ